MIFSNANISEGYMFVSKENKTIELIYTVLDMQKSLNSSFLKENAMESNFYPCFTVTSFFLSTRAKCFIKKIFLSTLHYICF